MEDDKWKEKKFVVTCIEREWRENTKDNIKRDRNIRYESRETKKKYIIYDRKIEENEVKKNNSEDSARAWSYLRFSLNSWN